MAASGCCLRRSSNSRCGMKTTMLSEIAIASAGCGSSSKTGISPNVRPGPNTFKTCSRPSGDVVTVRTRPRRTTPSPSDGSPFRKITSPG